MATPHALEQDEGSPCFDNIRSEANPEVDSPVELAGFRGRLDEVGLPSLLCILERERRTGMLVLNLPPGGGKAHLHLSEGRVFRAHLESREEPRNAELVYGLIGGMRGTFDFRPSGVVLDDDIQSSTTRLIFEGVRRMNEERPALPGESILDVDLPGGGPEAHPGSCRGCQDDEAPVDRLTPAPGKTLEWRSSRRNKVNGALAALAVAAFVMAVLSAVWGSGHGASDPRRNLPADALTATDRGEGPPVR